MKPSRPCRVLRRRLPVDFTLIELLAVIAILAILAAMLLPAMPNPLGKLNTDMAATGLVLAPMNTD